MTHAGQRTSGFWQSVRQLPDRTPLRTKLITAVLALVVVALAVISIAGIAFLRSYLYGQADNSLNDVINNSQPPISRLVLSAVQGAQPAGSPEGQYSVDWISPSGELRQVVVPSQGLGSNATLMPGQGPAVSPGAAWLSTGQPTTVGASSGGGRWRVVALSGNDFQLPDGTTIGGTVIVGVNFTGAYQTLARLTAVDLIVSLLLLLLLAILGVTVIRASLRPLNEIEETAGAIAAGDLTQRVPERDPRTEVGRLGRSLNIMLGQIETAFRQRSESAREARRSEERMRQFVADASHELRTPLTAIRGFAEYYRQRGGVVARQVSGPAASAQTEVSGEPETEEPTVAGASADGAPNGNGHLKPADLDRIMRRVEQESARMGILVEDLLLLARMDQQRPLEQHPVDLLTLAADAVHDARVVAPNRSIDLTVSSDIAPILVGDEVRLRQVIGNLMSNALTHTPDGTPIEVRLRSGTLDRPSTRGEFTAVGAAPPNPAHVPAAILEVTDRGPGLTPEQAQHAFERFYRADQARSTKGTGLGLAIVAALVAAHGGTVWVDSEPGQGATFGIALPLAPEAMEGPDDTGPVGYPEVIGDTEVIGNDFGPGDGPDVSGWPSPADEWRPTGPGWPTEQPPAP